MATGVRAALFVEYASVSLKAGRTDEGDELSVRLDVFGTAGHEVLNGIETRAD
jgi:hypothetical protein